MKIKSTLIILTIISALYSINIKAQEAVQESYTAVVQADSLSKDKLYANAKDWILTKFFTADNLIQFDDKEHNSIFVTGHIKMDNKQFPSWGKGGATSDNCTLTFKLEINFKENRYKYELKSLLYSFDRHGVMVDGHEESTFDKIQGMPKKKIPEVQQEAVSKIKKFIEDLNTAIKNAKNKDNW